MAPSTPTGLGGTPGDSSIALAWNENPELDVLGYKVYYGESSAAVTYLDQDFGGAPSDPAGWDDTGANNSQTTDDSLFKTFSVAGTTVFGTASEATNIHSHFVDNDSINWGNYEYTGRMYITNAQGGVGLTFLSQYPNDEDRYYRLRRWGTNAFHIAPHGTNVTGGSTDTGIVPQPDTWYLFRIQVEDTGVQTNIRARVWQDGEQEPTTWQVDCYDSNTTRLTNGAVGLWSMSLGNKYWDDLKVVSLGGGGSPFYGQPIDVGNVTAYDLTSLTNDVEYRVAVSAYDAQFESDLSNEILVTPSAGGPADTVPPEFSNINISPTVLSAQAEHNMATILFTVSEPLNADPSVNVGANDATFSGKSGNNYTYTYTAVGTEPEGTTNVTFSGTDLAGNVGVETCTSCLEFDFTPPTQSILIIGQEGFTERTALVAVTLTLSASDSGSGMGPGAEMQFSNDGVNWSTPEPYATSRIWDLIDIPLGTEQVREAHVKFKDVAENWSGPYSDSIILDKQPPSPPAEITFEP